MKEYVSERGVREVGWSGQEKSAWIGRGGDPSAVATPPRGHFRKGARRLSY